MESGYSHSEAKELILLSVEAAVMAKNRYCYENPNSESILIAASIGPYGAYLSDGSEYRGHYNISDEALRDFHNERITLLDQSDANILAFETFPDYREANVIADLTRHCHKPAWISFTTKNDHEISDGTPVEKCAQLFSHHPSVFAIGVNCLPPDRVSSLVRRLKSSCHDKKIIVYPNAGDVYDATSKNWKSTNDHTPQINHLLQEWLEAGADIVGGCCRIGADEISKMRLYLDQM
jgi:homocysteine S-methyltransferase